MVAVYAFDWGSLLYFVLGPSLWWLYISSFWIIRWGRNFTRKMNCNLHIVLQFNGGKFFKIAEKWVKKTDESWGHKKGRFQEPSGAAYTEAGLVGVHDVFFDDMTHTLPMKVTFEEVPHNPTEKGMKYSINPAIKNLETHLGHNAIQQVLRAMASTHPELLMLILFAIAGFAGGWIIYPMANPPHAVPCPLVNGTFKCP